MLDDVIDEVKVIMQTVPNIGSVNDYRRAVQTERDFQDVYKDAASGKVRAWDITRETTACNDRTVGAVEDLHVIVIRGYMSVSDKDASERTFQRLIEAVRGTFLIKRDLNGKVMETTPVQVRPVVAATFGPNQVLVHYCELSLTAVEFPRVTT